MFSIIQAAGWPIWFLLIASVIALALIIERLIYLRRRKILPPHLLDQVIREYREGRVDAATTDKLEKGSAFWGQCWRPDCSIPMFPATI